MFCCKYFVIMLFAVGPFTDRLFGDDAVDEATKLIGNPYVWGCKDPNGTYWTGAKFLSCNGGLDCTGLVQYSFGKVGIKLTESQQYLPPNRVTILKDSRCASPANCTLQELLSYGILQRGDLLWFDTRTTAEGYDPGNKLTGHVGIYESGTTMINALSEKYGIRRDDLLNAQLLDPHYWTERFMFGGRVMQSAVAGAVSPALAFDPAMLHTLTANTYPYAPFGLAVDNNGNLYVGEPSDDPYQVPNGQVLKLSLPGGAASTIGSGWINPEGLAVDVWGKNLYVADCSELALISLTTGSQTRLGSGLYEPCAVAVDKAQNVYAVEFGKDVVKISASDGSQSATGFGIKYPSAISTDASGNVYVVDYSNDNVVKIGANGGPQTVLGSGLKSPYGVAVDDLGNVYITDVGNDRVVEVLAASGNQITIPIAGLVGPRGLAIDQYGVIYISEVYGGPSGGYVLSLDRSQGSIQFSSQGFGTQTTQTVTITNQGTTPIAFEAPAYLLTGDVEDFQIQPSAVNGCPFTAGATLPPGTICTLSVTFAPTALGNRSATVTLNDNANNPKPQLLILTGVAVAGQPPTSLSITEYGVPTSSAAPFGITNGPDGALWFTESNGNKIGRASVAGSITDYSLPGLNAAPLPDPLGITSVPDAALWFTEQQRNRIGRITTTGVISEYDVPTSTTYPVSITAGPDGALWFSETGTNKIGRVSTSGVFAEYPLPAGHAYPYGIASGSDGALWFTEASSGSIGRITSSGLITEYGPTKGPPWGITPGPDGALWFIETSSGVSAHIGRITTAGAITEFPITSGAQGHSITSGPDGALWFTEDHGNKIGRITTAGVISEYAIPTLNSYPWTITTGPDRALWFTELQANKIARAAPVF